MIDRTAFAVGMAKLNLAYGREASEALTEVYFETIAPVMDTDEWLATVTEILRTHEGAFMPTPGQILARKRQRATTEATLEAERMFDAVFRCGVYSPENGTRWTFRGVEAQLGRAAAVAFVSAGGHHAFAWNTEKDRVFMLKRFTESYVEEVLQVPALPPGETPKALPAPRGAALTKRRR